MDSSSSRRYRIIGVAFYANKDSGGAHIGVIGNRIFNALDCDNLAERDSKERISCISWCKHSGDQHNVRAASCLSDVPFTGELHEKRGHTDCCRGTSIVLGFDVIGAIACDCYCVGTYECIFKNNVALTRSAQHGLQRTSMAGGI